MPLPAIAPETGTARTSSRLAKIRAAFFVAASLTGSIPCCASSAAVAVPPHRPAVTNPLLESETLVMQGRVDDAIDRLHALIGANPQDGRAHLLLCRAFYSEELADPAVAECEAALVNMADNSSAQDWMGRAYGLKADRSGPIAGYKLASKVKGAFEAAVRLDQKNSDAVNDAGEYYIGAPSIVGGGVEKALALADQVEAHLPQAAHRIRGLAADKQRDYGTAEREFKAAVGVAGQPEAWFDLGHFYSQHGKDAQALEALHHAVEADRSRGPSLVDVASVLIKMKKQPDVSQRVLREYLASGTKSDAAPAFRAYVELGKVLEANGDKQAAATQFESALSLAKDYAPAKKAMQHL